MMPIPEETSPPANDNDLLVMDQQVCFAIFVIKCQNKLVTYRIYSIKRFGYLSNFWTESGCLLEVGTLNFHHFQQV